MDSYNPLADILDTFQSSANVIKVLWLIVPPAFLLGLIALILRFRVELKRSERELPGKLVFSVYRDDDGRLRVVNHVPQIEKQPPLLLLENLACEPIDKW